MSDIPALSGLDLIPYIGSNGELPNQFQGTIGVYAIFGQDQTLQYVGYSRDVYLSLRQHLVRQPEACYWVKVQTIDRPSRAVLEEIRAAWLAENGELPPGNGAHESQWNQAIDVKQLMTPEEENSYTSAIDELSQTKILKQAARRVEAQILEILKVRGLTEEIRFNPKLKETGLLDLKS